ncbi:hypothetical protein Glove_323g18 [Diversispora epigaea]|uniref:Uncharacterized protein n=1 Tax=Diversispora epigaea TaxID=1348612 RepID=A0A397HNL6_9GLOM|nr:hypothetical protein Glove_323g18 [Diversispora epigaea]
MVQLDFDFKPERLTTLLWSIMEFHEYGNVEIKIQMMVGAYNVILNVSNRALEIGRVETNMWLWENRFSYLVWKEGHIKSGIFDKNNGIEKFRKSFKVREILRIARCNPEINNGMKFMKDVLRNYLKSTNYHGK